MSKSRSSTATSSIRDFKDMKDMSAKNNDSGRKIYDLADTPENNPGYYEHRSFQIGLEDETVAVVIDGVDMFKLANAIKNTLPNNQNFSFDFDNLSRILYTNFPNLRRTWYLTTQLIERNDTDKRDGFSHIRGLIDFLEFHRYTVVTVDKYIESEDDAASSGYRYKDMPSLDVDITTALFMAGRVANHVIFFGSDKKYATPLRVLHSDFGKTITVVSALIEDRFNIPAEMRKIDNFVNLNDPWFIDRLNNKNRKQIPRSFGVNSSDDENKSA